MGYVMVPVPEQYVEDVMQFILGQIARASILDWDEEAIHDLFAKVDEPSRSLLAFVSRAVVTGKELPEEDASRLLELSGRETIGISRELNEVARDSSHPGIIWRRTVVETLPNGRSIEKGVFGMAPEVAQLVRAAEMADLRAGATLPGDTA